MPENEWYDQDTIRDVWRDAPLDAEVCGLVVGTALEEVQIYLTTAKLWKEGDDIPVRYRLAQLQHTRNTWNGAQVGPDGGLGDGEFVIRPRPMDWLVIQHLNPRTNLPVIG